MMLLSKHSIQRIRERLHERNPNKIHKMACKAWVAGSLVFKDNKKTIKKYNGYYWVFQNNPVKFITVYEKGLKI